MTVTLRNGIYFDQEFKPRRPTWADRLWIGVIWVGIGTSLLMGVMLLLSVAWLLGMVARAVVRVVQP